MDVSADVSEDVSEGGGVEAGRAEAAVSTGGVGVPRGGGVEAAAGAGREEASRKVRAQVGEEGAHEPRDLQDGSREGLGRRLSEGVSRAGGGAAAPPGCCALACASWYLESFL